MEIKPDKIEDEILSYKKKLLSNKFNLNSESKIKSL